DGRHATPPYLSVFGRIEGDCIACNCVLCRVQHPLNEQSDRRFHLPFDDTQTNNSALQYKEDNCIHNGIIEEVSGVETTHMPGQLTSQLPNLSQPGGGTYRCVVFLSSQRR